MAEPKQKDWKEIGKKLIFLIVIVLIYSIGYMSPYTIFNDSFSLSIGAQSIQSIHHIGDVMDVCYIGIVNLLFLFLGERIGVIIGFQIVIGIFSALFIFVGFYAIKQKILAYILTFLYAALPFVFYRQMNDDSIIMLGLFISFLLMVILLAASRIMKKRESDKPYEMLESLSQMEQKNEKEPKVVMGADGNMIQLLNNPLPTPKRHVPRKMDYDIEVPLEKMHYDIEQIEKNYYDIS